ncbi:hypothetical protein QYM36_011695 [Artemia franciscana]|uniref:Uncharacterized protein n=1 Tax=Artemia franciscana TaxID=6661 RepID=A0AA88HVV0_ARTSF|nr:hypothetical protein QYM36_011695 [Artemia franciscana]
MTPKITSGLMNYETVCDRIVIAHLKGQSNDLTLLSAYANIHDAFDHLKDKFYADLQLTLSKIPRKYILVIGSDFIARIGTRLIVSGPLATLAWATVVLKELVFSFLLC